MFHVEHRRNAEERIVPRGTILLFCVALEGIKWYNYKTETIFRR